MLINYHYFTVHLQIEEISRRLRTGDLGIPPVPEDRFDFYNHMFWWFTGYPKLFLKNCQLEILYICSLKLKKNYVEDYFLWKFYPFCLVFFFFYLINGNVGFDETHMHTYFQSKKPYLTSTSTNTLCMDIATNINIWCMHFIDF